MKFQSAARIDADSFMRLNSNSLDPGLFNNLSLLLLSRSSLRVQLVLRIDPDILHSAHTDWFDYFFGTAYASAV